MPKLQVTRTSMEFENQSPVTIVNDPSKPNFFDAVPTINRDEGENEENLEERRLFGTRIRKFLRLLAGE